jgi:YVTN family beta-propeller protein
LKTHRLRWPLIAAACALLVCVPRIPSCAQATPPLPTGKTIVQPPIGSNVDVGNLPMNMITSPDGRYAIVSDMGEEERLSVIRCSDGSLVSSVLVGGRSSRNREGLYYGLAAHGNADGSATVYASYGSASAVGVYTLSAAGAIAAASEISLTPGDYPAGIAVSPDGHTLFIANKTFYLRGDDGRPLTTPGQLIIVDTMAEKETARLDLSDKLTSYPFAVAAVASKVYVTSDRDGLVYVVDCAEPAHPKLVKTVVTGSHPVGLFANKSGSRLYVANAQSDTVSVIDTTSDRVVDTILTRPADNRGLPGASPLAVTLSPDETTLYAALSDMNAVAVIDVSGKSGRLTGFIPVGWYPTSVAASGAGVLVANGKGVAPRIPNPQHGAGEGRAGYILNVLRGSVEYIRTPDSSDLTKDTATVLANNGPMSSGAAMPADLPVGKIRHIIYIIKENRTYDQILGDMPAGNGDPSLTLFGKDVTPNQHSLAARFVLLDNFYDCGEVSGDGWPWSTQGIASEFIEKNVPYSYSGHGHSYDFEGSNNGYPTGGVPNPAVDPHGRPLVSSDSPFAHGAPPIADVGAAPRGHLWDDARAAGISYRNYGFFYAFGNGTYQFGATAAGQNTYSYVPGTLPDNYPGSAHLLPAGSLAPGKKISDAGISDTDYREFDLSYADSEAAYTYYSKMPAGAPGRDSLLYPHAAFGYYNEPSRFSEWNREFQIMLNADPTGGDVPTLMFVRFPNDHTGGYRGGGHTPRSDVADNDYAVGQLVDAVSHSAIWRSTAIFVIEDDAQDGADHVDCHRSTCYVISPWIQKNSVDSAFYNTDSVLHTIELLLKLPPMSRYDAYARPFGDWDKSPSNDDPYSAVLPDFSIIGDIVPEEGRLPAGDPRRTLIHLSEKMDFVHPDSAPAAVLNRVVWQSVRGTNTVPPPPRTSLTTTTDND